VNETELRARFARLSSELGAPAPPFRAVLAAEPPRTRRSPACALGFALPALCLLALLWWTAEMPGTGRDAEPVSEAVLETFSTWGTPTDLLLRPPGAHLTSTLPSFGIPIPAPSRTPAEPTSEAHTRRIA
jgi:hypothetical protein